MLFNQWIQSAVYEVRIPIYILKDLRKEELNSNLSHIEDLFIKLNQKKRKLLLFESYHSPKPVRRVSILKGNFSTKPCRKEKKKILQEGEPNRVTDDRKF